MFGTAAAVTAAVMGGAAAVRVHDVAEMRDVVRVAEALAGGRRWASRRGIMIKMRGDHGRRNQDAVRN